MAADVSLVVDIDTNKATRGVDNLKRSIGSLAAQVGKKMSMSFQVMLGNLASQAVGAAIAAVKDMAKEIYKANLTIEERIFQTQRALGDMSKTGSKAIQVAIEDLARSSGQKIEDVAATFQVLSDAEGMTLQRTKEVATAGFSLTRILGLTADEAAKSGIAIDSIMKGLDVQDVDNAKSLAYHLKTVADLDFSEQKSFISKLKGIKISANELGALFTWAAQGSRDKAQVRGILDDFALMSVEKGMRNKTTAAAGGGLAGIMQFMAKSGTGKSKLLASEWLKEGGAKAAMGTTPASLSGLETGARSLMAVRQAESEAAKANALTFAGTSAVVASNEALVATNQELARVISNASGQNRERLTFGADGVVKSERNTMFDRPVEFAERPKRYREGPGGYANPLNLYIGLANMIDRNMSK